MFRLIQVLIFFNVCLSIRQVNAQDTCTFNLSGFVKDDHNQRPLPYSRVFISELKKTTLSDSIGYYTLKGLCKGNYKVSCKHIGCAIINVTVQVEGNTERNFYPEHHVEIEEVTVFAKIVEGSSLNKNELSAKEVNEISGLSLGDGLMKLNGISKLSTGNNISKPVIHGLHSNRILILNNGIRQEGQQWGNEHAPEIDPFIAGELSVIKGAKSVQYGPDAIAGVIFVNPKELRNTPGISGELNLVGFSNGLQGNTSATLNGNLNKITALRWRLQGTFKRGGNVHSPDYYLKNTGLKEYNFSWALAYLKPKFGIDFFYSQFNTDIGIFSASHIGNLTDLEAAFQATSPLEAADFTYTIGRLRQRIEHELFKTKGYIKTGKKGKLTFTYARQYNKRLEYDKHPPLNDSLANLNLPSLKFELTTHTADIAWQHNSYKSMKGSLGVNGIYQGNTYEGRFFIPNFRKIGLGVFLIEQWKPVKSRWEFDCGIRFDNVNQKAYMWKGDSIISPSQNYQNFSGTLGAFYMLSKDLFVRANVGSAWRPPAINELYSKGLHHGAAAVEIGDSLLLTEKALNFNVSIEYSGKKFQLVLDVYNNIINDFIYLRPSLVPTLTIKGAFPTFEYMQVNAQLRGVDLTVNYSITDHFKIISKTAILRALNRTTGNFLAMMPSDRFENTLEYSFKDCKKWKNPYISISVLSVLKQTRVPENSDYSLPPNGYTLLNVTAGIKIPAKEQHVLVGVTVNNLLNTRYRDYMNRFRYFTDEQGTNISLRVSVPFTLFTPKSIHE